MTPGKGGDAYTGRPRVTVPSGAVPKHRPRFDPDAPKRMEVERLASPAPAHLLGLYVVRLYDEADQLIATCGPYHVQERDGCINLFRSHGWTRFKKGNDE